MASVHDVAAAIVARHGSMSPTKLQKLVYYSQAWHLVWEERPLFDAKIEAWVGGPVVRALWDRHRGEFVIDDWPDGDETRLEADELSTIEAVVEAYGKMSGAALSALTHNEQPWVAARAGLAPGQRGNRQIALQEMADYYGGLNASSDATPVTELVEAADAL